MWYADSYMDEIRETQGYLFEMVALKNLDFFDFVRKYMKSKLKNYIDYRSAVHSNMMGNEQFEWMEKNYKLKEGCKVDFVLANWIGEFYAILQYNTKIESKDLVEILPPDKLFRMSRVLHDIDLDLAVDRVIKELKKEGKIK